MQLLANICDNDYDNCQYQAGIALDGDIGEAPARSAKASGVEGKNQAIICVNSGYQICTKKC